MVAPWKIEEVKLLSKKIKESKVIGLVKISGIPSRQFQRIRKNLKDVSIRVAKTAL